MRGVWDFANAAGADAVLMADGGLLAEVNRRCDGRGPAVVIEATGYPDAIVSAFDLARPGGRVVLLGSTRGETDQVNFYRDVHKKGLVIIGAHDSTRPSVDSSAGWWTQLDDQRVAMRLLAAGRIQVASLITHRFKWCDVTASYELLKSWDLETLGMVLNWRDA
ncbi:MAG: zinc-binding dehydrogenase [Caldilineaceae bacterium]|nr:zinc-binding dehydrogenase [Caldilineaceae bacterium]